MVSADGWGPTSLADDRGQLILVGAIAMALIVIGLVLVINTALFTDVVGSEGTVEGAKGAGVASEEIEDSVGQVVHEENVDGSRATTVEWSDVRGTTEGNLTDLLLNTSLDGQGAYLDVTLGADRKPGQFVYQDGDTPFSTASVPRGPSDRTAVGHFELGVLPSVSGTVQITVQGSAAGSETLTVTTDGSSDVDVNPSTGSCPTVEGAGSYLWIDVRHGVDATGQCHFDLFQSLEGPYRVTVDQTGGSPQGQYRMVVDEDASSDLPCGVLNVHCEGAVWTYELSYTYETIETTAEADSVEVPVYD